MDSHFESKTENPRYFFVYYLIIGAGHSNGILPQSRPTEGEPDNGFNIAGAMEFLMDRHKAPVVICSFYETNEKNSIRWNDFLVRAQTKYPFVGIPSQKPDPEKVIPIFPIMPSVE